MCARAKSGWGWRNASSADGDKGRGGGIRSHSSSESEYVDEHSKSVTDASESVRSPTTPRGPPWREEPREMSDVSLGVATRTVI